MAETKLIKQNSGFRIVADGESLYPYAYMTYFEENNRYAEFFKAGCRLYSVGAFFSSLPINAGTGFTPWGKKGIFDEEEPDYSLFENELDRILAADPDALIFPRVFISMPRRWIDAHPLDCTDGRDVVRGGGGQPRESHLSPEYRKEGERLLREFIAYVRSSKYDKHIIGYHITGGNTQEWMFFDMNGGVCPRSEELFGKYLDGVLPGRKPGPEPLPPESAFEGEGEITDIKAKLYLDFINEEMAKTISHFCRVAKECVDSKQLVGVFYGYVQEQTSPFFGSMAMEKLIDDGNVDFFSSPDSYFHTRPLGVDWGEMTCGESVKYHGKLYFLENDIRTFLSRYPSQSRPGCDPERRYDSPVWLGPPTEEASLWAIRKAFFRQLTHGNGLWWFDMWGGWYSTGRIMDEIALFGRIGALDGPEEPLTPQTALVFDETYSRRIKKNDPLFRIQKLTKEVMGNTGVPFDAVYSFDEKLCEKYEVLVFPFPEKYASDEIKKIAESRRVNGENFFFCDGIPTADSLREKLVSLGARCWCDSGEVVYAGNGWLCVHAASEGEKTVRLPDKFHVVPLYGSDSFDGDRIKVKMQKHETLAWRLERL
ncbi:MAG: hypothetical protein IJV00_09705 [Clostridia bacterium]|nr:hypothetical protein [Clostridia bacterium]